MTKTSVLIPVHTNTFYIELQRVGRLLHASTEYRPIMLFAWPYPTIVRDIEQCLADGLTCLDEFGRAIARGSRSPPSHAETPPGPVLQKSRRHLVLQPRRLLKAAYRRGRRAAGIVARWFHGNYFYYLRHHRQRARFIHGVLRDTDARLMILAGDMVGYDTSDCIKAAHDQGVRVVLVPSTMSNGLEQAEVYFNDPAYHLNSLVNIAAAWRHPRWVRRHRGKSILRRPGGDVFAMESLGSAPPLPWIFNSGAADAICVESEAMREYYLEGGLPAEQLVATGSLANDTLARSIRDTVPARRRLLEELQLPADDPFFLVAFPPDFLYLTGGRPECDFKSYEELTRFWLSTLKKIKNHNIVIALHPSVVRDSMLHLETERIKIASLGTAALVPLCDLFVASVSSTIRWAIAAGKPVVNYDVYRYRYTDYLKVPGVILVEEQSDFEAVMLRLANEPAFFAEIRRKQEACAHQWGVLDGNVGKRMLDLFDRLAGERHRVAA